jgi:DNA-binding transcriptional regulator LsrR (DeoR family)
LKNTKNKKLKFAMLMEDVTQKEVAAEMSINARVFRNKINNSVVNGYVARFKPCEKKWLAERFNLKESEIE